MKIWDVILPPVLVFDGMEPSPLNDISYPQGSDFMIATVRIP
jgi:hypothetical protein